MGPCLGGGLETAMACHYRIAVDGKYILFLFILIPHFETKCLGINTI